METETYHGTERIKEKSWSQSEAQSSEELIYLTGLPWGTVSVMNVWVDYATS